MAKQIAGLHSRMSGFEARHHIAISGGGEKNILLGNGFGTSQDFWLPLLPWLEARGRVIRFDWAVDFPHFDITRYGELDGFIDDMLTVIERTRSSPCVLIGHSMSAMIGMLAAKLAPQSFERIVMIAPAPCYIRSPDYAAGFSGEEIDGLLAQIDDNYLAWTAAFARIAVGGPANRAAAEDFCEGLRAMRPDVALSLARLLFTMDLRAQLGGFETPTTIIQPTADPVVPVAVGQYLANCWPQAELAVIEAAGHLPHVTALEKVKDVLDRVLSIPSA